MLEVSLKRGPGRPRKHPVKIQTGEKRGPGRPRKYPQKPENQVKRGRGRPRKYTVLGKDHVQNICKKMDSASLLKHMFQYFTKLLLIHDKLEQADEKNAAIYKRLKSLDFQMAEVAKTILKGEYMNSSIEENLFSE